MPHRALIFIPLTDPHIRKWMVVCWTYCMRKRYKPSAVVHEWADVRRLMLTGEADKVVVAIPDHVDWLEVISEQPDPATPPSSQQRTHRT